MRKTTGLPPFIKVFKNESCAISALKILLMAKESGRTNKQVLEVQAFKDLFDDFYVKNTSDLQLEWRLKNIARDLKKMSFEDLNVEFHDYKKYFEGTRRVSIKKDI